MDTSQWRLKTAQRKALDLYRKSSSWRYMVSMLILFVILVLIIVLVIKLGR